jgi:hypothetical protein
MLENIFKLCISCGSVDYMVLLCIDIEFYSSSAGSVVATSDGNTNRHKNPSSGSS